jgi:nitrogen fixation protein NifX
MPAQKLQLFDRESPEPAPCAAHLRIAIATQDLKHLNAHFGSARRFAVYDVTPETSRFVEAHAFGDVSDETGAHNPSGDDKIGQKVEALAGCNLLFVLAIGGPAAARIVRAHIHPVKLPAPETIESILARVQAMMRGNPPPWLRKAMAPQSQRSQGRSMAFLDEES